jgi:hypothetical protein
MSVQFTTNGLRVESKGSGPIPIDDNRGGRAPAQCWLIISEDGGPLPDPCSAMAAVRPHVEIGVGAWQFGSGTDKCSLEIELPAALPGHKVRELVCIVAERRATAG